MARALNRLAHWLTISKGKFELSQHKKPISYLSLYRYATRWDYFYIAIALVSCTLEGFVDALVVFAYGEYLAMLVDRNFGLGATSKTYTLPLFGGGKILINATHEENMLELRNDSWAFGTIAIIIAFVALIAGTLAVDLMNFVGLRMISKLRKAFFEATIRKDIEWHEVARNQNFALHMTDSMEKIRVATSEKLPIFISSMLYATFCIVMAFVFGLKLALSAIWFVILILISNIIAAKFQKKFTILEQNAYMKAGNLVEEIISAIHTVVAFCGEKLEGRHYDEVLVSARSAGKWKGCLSGIGYTMPRLLLFVSTATILFNGTKLILEDRDKIEREYTPAVITFVFYGISIGLDYAGRFSPYLDCFAVGVASAGPIFEVIDSVAKIDPMSSDGKILSNGLKGDIEFRDVFFKYPSRADAVVLRGLNFNVRAGQTVAIVGHSGCGKSTCLQLLQRFYDTASGKIIIDDSDIQKYNVSWLRSNIAIVGQEPVLFQGTIGENIRYGKPEATTKDIEDAAQAAGAHNFIGKLPYGYETSITEKGVQLSGGQKQRIAIARALVSNPTILLLDEATSALDYHSEKAVQKALNLASQGRTTIVVSHRLSAIKDADRIFFLHEGKVAEEGSHDELMNLRGRYFEMVKSHKLDEDDASEEDNKKDEEVSDISLEQNNNTPNSEIPTKEHFTLIEKDQNEHKKDKNQKMFFIRTFIRIIRIARQNWGILIIATICASLFGCVQAALSMILGEYYGALAEPNSDDVLRHTSFIALICLVVALISGTICYTERCLFNLVGVEVTARLRSLTFKTILAQEIGWFDDKQNSVGALSARLSGDAASVHDVIGYPLSGIIQAAANLISGLSLGFYFSWQMSLVCLCTAPLMIGSFVFESLYLGRIAVLENKILQEISQFSTEAIANIRTIASLCREPQLIVDCNNEAAKYMEQMRKSLRLRGIVFSSQWSILYLGYAFGITYGGLLCSEGVIRVSDVIRVGGVLISGLMLLAVSLALCPALVSGLIAADRLFRIVDRKSQIKPMPTCDNPTAIDNPSSTVTYSDVFFRYPSRPDVQVLEGINLEILQGKTVALVGPSGCGKSTLIQLLLRYYDPIRGDIYLEGQSIHRDVTLTTLRYRLGIVSQEPTLFEKTIAENIAYGDNSREVIMAEIVEAAKLANALSFITALPNGFDTKLGARGTQLSGGQKQRIAIARALVRNPQVLLLDEATSALDFESERIVQSALDRAVSGRTSIVIAHRLSTIQNADLICFIQDGLIVERGSHSQLLATNGLYAQLYKSQPDDD